MRDELGRDDRFLVHTARTVDEARFLLETGAFDVAVIAEDAWGTDGLAFVDSARELQGSLAVVLVGEREERGRRPGGVMGCAARDQLCVPGYLARHVAEAHEIHRILRRRSTMSRWLEREAKTDRLTGLNNRRAFEAQLGAACERSVATGVPCAVIVADIADMRVVNQVHGHEVGNAMIRRAAGALARCIRGADFIARIGGDEFGIVVEEADLDLARRIARRIAHRIDELNEDEWAEELPLTLTFAVASGITDDAEALLTAAMAQLGNRVPVRRAPILPGLWRLDDGPSVA